MKFYDDYFELMSKAMKNINHDEMDKAVELIKHTSKSGKKLIFAGNGGSAAMSSHATVDFTKAAKIRAINFNEADLLTCFANDYGYENVFAKALDHYADAGDLFIVISSSGKSENVNRAAVRAKELGLNIITLSGFEPDNPLREKGHFNFWCDSKAYNIVEMTHHIWLVAMVDRIVGDIYYSSNI